MRYLIVYGSNQGQTARIATRIAGALEERGHAVDVHDGQHIPAGLTMDQYAGVIVGGSVNAGRFQRYISEFVKDYREQLQRIPAAFVAVSLAEAFPDVKRRATATEQIDRFLRETNWRPDTVLSVSGAIPHSRLSWVMRRIFYRSLGDGVRTEIADHEYTDWDSVEQFVDEFVTIAQPQRVAVSVA